MGTYILHRARTEADIRECLSVRRIVFIEGQGIAEELEIDGFDDRCIHFICRHTQENLGGGLTTFTPVAAARILPCGDTAKIQRVAVVDSHQKKGVGAEIMQAMIDYARAERFTQIVLGSQANVVVFYIKLGFKTCGEPYEEAGIQHQKMCLIF